MKYNLPVYYTSLSFKEKREVREQYIQLQKGQCFYCGNSLKKPPIEKVLKARINKKLFPKGFFNHPIHLQHCHNTDLTEGAVHARCNAYMWQYLGR